MKGIRKMPRGRLYWTKNRKIERHENLIQKLLNRVHTLEYLVETMTNLIEKNTDLIVKIVEKEE